MTYANFVVVDGAVQLTATIPDEKLVRGGFAGTRLGALELLVRHASRGLAAFARDPQVGRASIEDDFEALTRCTDRYLAVVLGLEEASSYSGSAIS